MKSTLTLVGVIALTASIHSVAGQTACADQAVFNLCQQNQDTYIATCAPTDYQCLCRWNKAKLSCWDSCPNDPAKGTQENIVAADCSVPGANVTVSAWSSSAMPTPTAVSASPSASNATASASTKPSSAAHQLTSTTGTLIGSMAMVVAAYFL